MIFIKIIRGFLSAKLKTYDLSLNVVSDIYSSENTLNGAFVGGYVRNTNVSDSGEGSIVGAGINAGLFGANKLSYGLIHYYGGVLAGKHSYKLSFTQENDDDIKADGDYYYLAALGGVAMSNRYHISKFMLEPEVGFKFAYANASKASINAIQGTESSRLEFDLPNYNGSEYYLNGAISRYFGDKEQYSVNFTPSVWCRKDTLDLNQCGTGIELGYNASVFDSKIGLNLDVKHSDKTTSGNVKFEVEKSFYIGDVAFDTSVSDSNDIGVNINYSKHF
ncbi:hypothetical protein RJD39_19930 [Vibrio scophthalmi]|uniref:hypothetical protein n=1 Tax=Vibrio scophthalmi TaxID=45658 RepID=UPI003873BB02